MSIGVRLIHKKKIYENFNGAFLWRVALNEQDKYEIPFYFSPSLDKALKSISIKGFGRANNISRAVCHSHRGGECLFTIETNKDVWGKSHQINFKENKKFNRYECPLY